ncbi:MAG: DUF1573 domain-containing protein [Verrucomicrobia bacterium]|nr:DUF1573 domain-containing protein [Verrucomicrobiota bacterium]
MRARGKFLKTIFGLALSLPLLAPAQSPLAWDAMSKERTAVVGDEKIPFTFSVTNVSTQEITINRVSTSCGCTFARPPSQPWKLAPGATGEIAVDMDIRGKSGVLIKSVNFDATAPAPPLIVKVTIPPEVFEALNGRMRNQQLAMNDRQAVFKGDCASCHATPTVGKLGQELFAAACGICHDTAHRASMVPDLRAPKVPTNKDYWRMWTTKGKPGSLMPAFAKADGGPLTDQQVESLVDYLDKTIPSPAQPSGAPAVNKQP